ncbi:MAG: CDP-alcohol phosphatidyltransferase family protein [Planctomycetes bacterium]|jgi:phosphatidylglycerophosphate synthase|nr:CDP-alcohol phosphatidyltransferase family protein [Planctomycetota bacterium]
MSRRWPEYWVRVQAAMWLPVLAVSAVRPELLQQAEPPIGRGWVAGGMAVSYVALLACLRAGRTIADLLTMARCLTIVALVAMAPLPSWVAFGFAATAAAADLVDGALARRFGESAFGAELDMESDQFTVLGLALMAVVSGGGVQALLLPAMKYAFALAAWWLTIPASEPKPIAGDNRRGRLVCAAVVVSLLLANCPLVPRRVGDTATAIATGLLAWSFTGDARWLWQHVRRRAA